MENGRVTEPHLRVAVLTPLYRPSLGGVQETMRLYCEYLTERGFEVRVYTSQLRRMDELKTGQWKTVRNFPSEELKNGIRITRFPAGGVWEAVLGLCSAASLKLHLPFARTLRRIYRTRGMRKTALLRELAKFKPKIILAAPATDSVLSIGLEAIRHLPDARLFVFTALHISDLQVKDLEWLMRQLRQADMTLVITEYEKKFLISHGLNPDKVALTGPGVDVGHFLSMSGDMADKRVMELVLDKKYVLFFGRKQEGKGIESLIEAVEILRQDYPELYVTLAGEETTYSEAASAGRRLKPFIIDIGHVDEATKLQLMKNGLAFSMVSRADSFGIVYCESWLAHRPVIGENNGQMRCVIRDGEDGFLVPYGDARALAEKIRYFLENPDEADRMGEQGYQKVMKMFGAHAVEHKLYDLILRT